ncbi:cupin domain-containing protein [Streptomyces sp. NPDC048650]|uniref:cupin domain-containing protein n=1 Tax=unclassified Streptomyces TaxID=2593676 RepID=UPI0037106998
MPSPVCAYDLDDLTAPLGTRAFHRGVYGRAFHLFTGAPDDRFDALFGWQDLNEILSRHRLTPRQLRVVQDGRLVSSDAYTVPELSRRRIPWHRLVPTALTERLRSGGTLALSEVDVFHSRVGRLAAAVERRLRERVEVTAYAAWPGAEGFGPHRDDHDVFVLQVAGHKRWHLHGRAAGPVGAALADRSGRAGQECPGPLEADVLLEPGQVLYVPRGWWHGTRTETAPSLHLTLGVWRPTPADLLGWLGAALPDDPALDVSLLRGKGPAASSDALSQLRSALAERLDDPAVLEAFFAARDAARPSRESFSLPNGSSSWT